ncbi:F-box/kelch-repeat protein [Senna tora]|uniref:F-box/kelch-repeat protein n=1 Tax=Senna tora TaxID=362788 RepID=A0A834U0I3_9FABA|nr:F-box/kelch-repeat protein [Senna tora]
MLPSTLSIPIERHYERESFKQLVVSGPPDSDSCIVAAIVHDAPNNKIVFCRIQDKCWTLLTGTAANAQYLDFKSIAIHGNKLYAVDWVEWKYLMIFNLENANAITGHRIYMFLSMPEDSISEEDDTRRFGFEYAFDCIQSFLGIDPSRGDVFLVRQLVRATKFRARPRILFPCSTANKFWVFKLDLKGLRWIRVDDLDNRLLFLDNNGVKVLSPNHIFITQSPPHLLHPNSLYFTHTYLHLDLQCTYEHHIGMFSLQHKTISLFIQNSNPRLGFPPQSLWFMPTFG